MEEYIELVRDSLNELDTDLSDKELRKLSKRCVKACQIYIKDNYIDDNDNNILNLKLNYLILKLDKNIINLIVVEKTIRIKDLLYKNIYETNDTLKQEQDILLSKVVDNNNYSCNLYKCPRCKARKHTYREVQTRSIDEPKSVKCICLVCGMKFSIS